MGILGAIVLSKALLMRAAQAELPECRSVGAEFVGHQQFRREALFPEQLAHQPQRRPLVASTLNQHIENLALVIDSAPQIHLPAGDSHDHLVEMPPIGPASAGTTEAPPNPGPELQNPAPPRLVGNLQPALSE